jgi:hypothetical protein
MNPINYVGSKADRLVIVRRSQWVRSLTVERMTRLVVLLAPRHQSVHSSAGSGSVPSGLARIHTTAAHLVFDRLGTAPILMSFGRGLQLSGHFVVKESLAGSRPQTVDEGLGFHLRAESMLALPHCGSVLGAVTLLPSCEYALTAREPAPSRFG